MPTMMMISSRCFLLILWLFITFASTDVHSSKQNHCRQVDTILFSKRWTNEAKQFFERQDYGKRDAAAVAVAATPTLAQQIQSEQASDPVGAAKSVQTIPFLANNASGVTQTQFQLIQGDSNEAQLPWNKAAKFIQNAATTADEAGGWQKLPEVEGFLLNRTWEIVPGAIIPFYSTLGVDPNQIKRAIITFPGKPRDSWKYANLVRNALEAVYVNSSFGVEKGTVLIVSPFWGDQLDYAAGSLQPNEIYFHGSGWMAGLESKGPNLTHSLTSYEIMDNFTDMLFDKTQYPNLNQVVIAGHSMGGQASQRYAVLKKQKAYDPNMSWWVGNPGSWAFLSPDRPYYNDTCANSYNTWEYGLSQDLRNMTKYARYACTVDLNWVVKTFIGRNVHYALGLLDNGPGDTHCQARDQGGNHLDRGSQFVLHVQKVNKGIWPTTQTVDFIGNTSHQDFAMISANSSLHWLFVNNYNVRFPDIVPWNPINHSHHHDQNGTTLKPIPKKFATHGNEALASALLGGSLILFILIFTFLRKLFPPNFDEDAFEAFYNNSPYTTSKIKPFPYFDGDGNDSYTTPPPPLIKFTSSPKEERFKNRKKTMANMF